MAYILIFVLAVLLLLLSVKMLVIKRELKRLSSEMKKNDDGHTLSVELVDRDLQDMILEVDRLYGHIRDIRNDGREKEKALRDSVSMISHDMRTPLTSVIGYLQLAKRSEDQDEIRADIDTALERAQYLNRLVNDFFELSLIGAGQTKPAIERLNLSGMICEEILAQSPEIDRQGIEPRFEQADTDIFVMADRKMLSRILQNLISNAVRYTQNRLDIDIDTGKDVTFSIVTDSDKAVDTDRIFDMFYMEDQSRHKGGTGIGLYIVRRFTESMGGSIRAEQDGGQFAITVTLPGDTDM